MRGYRHEMKPRKGTGETLMELSQYALEPRRELNLRLLVEQHSGTRCGHDAIWGSRSVNKPNLEYFGKTFEDLKKWGTSDAVHPDDLPQAIEIWMEAIRDRPALRC